MRAQLAGAGKEEVCRRFSSTTTTADLEGLYSRLLVDTNR